MVYIVNHNDRNAVIAAKREREREEKIGSEREARERDNR